MVENVDEWFEIERMARSARFWDRQEVLLRSLLERHSESAEAVRRYLPEAALVETGSTSLTVVLVPGFRKCFGPAPGTQLFGLREAASPEEAFLFLVHVYYHELSALFASDWTRRCEEPETSADLKHWVLSLVQNEGLANYAVLGPVLELRDRNTPFAYFTYAGMIGDAAATADSMRVLRKVFRDTDEANWRLLKPHVSLLLKDERLPVINLVGIHLARTIAEHFGEPQLLDGSEPEEFFERYRRTGDALVPDLFGKGVSDADLYRLSEPLRA